MRMTAALLTVVIMAACTDEAPPGPVDSGPITITVNSINESDIRTPGHFQKDENISNETGNPWGEFIDRAERICGAAPASFEVRDVTVQLDESDDVDTLAEIATGSITVFFLSTRGSDEDAVRVDVASAQQIQGAGPHALVVSSSPDDLLALHERLVGGDFHVGLRGETARDPEHPFSMDVRIVFSARALCG